MTKILDFHIKKLDSLKKYPDEIFFRGDTKLLNKPSISIVGTRRPINYTKQLCYEISSNVIYKKKLKSIIINLNGVVIWKM